MYQQSVDKAWISAKKDLLIFILMILLFFLLGAIMLYLENTFSTNVPRYIFIGIILIGLYAFYRLRLIGYRYTVFYKPLEPVYDPRFDAMRPVESYPYPVGTVIFERIVSAKGTILLTLDVSEIISVDKFSVDNAANHGKSLNVRSSNKGDAYILVYSKNGVEGSVLFSPDEEFLEHLHEAIEYKPAEDDNAIDEESVSQDE